MGHWAPTGIEPMDYDDDYSLLSSWSKNTQNQNLRLLRQKTPQLTSTQLRFTNGIHWTT